MEHESHWPWGQWERREIGTTEQPFLFSSWWGGRLSSYNPSWSTAEENSPFTLWWSRGLIPKRLVTLREASAEAINCREDCSPQKQFMTVAEVLRGLPPVGGTPGDGYEEFSLWGGRSGRNVMEWTGIYGISHSLPICTAAGEEETTELGLGRKGDGGKVIKTWQCAVIGVPDLTAFCTCCGSKC